MAFEDASGVVVSILEARAKAIQQGNALPWSTDGMVDYNHFTAEVFERSKEHNEWMSSRQLHRRGQAGTLNENGMMSTLLKLGWMSGMQRDLRTQFVSSVSRGRTSQDQTRYSEITCIHALRNLQRFKLMIANRMA